ncbi:asparagine synthase (glutamine-hydrolyzing) [Halobellus rubicundus]|uniref:Putative asparagine synthetase [glutamine-hydrolyzing] n=1 Tax=Halobellus rubicundus TaxID=2996466 RepID=A0ABD5MEA2_9EURY
MCGISGKFSFNRAPSDDLGESMAACMSHRGPDDKGIYANGPVVLSHRRLSILDLSRTGSQPMANEDSTVHIVFNGEIYNYRELRNRLGGHTFRSETDTEVLLHLYEDMGIECLSLLRGMFAFAIWDERKERLFLARDRLGQKPLFYHNDESGFTFGSTIKAILQDEAIEAKPDLPAIRSYLTYQYVPAPHTGFERVRSLEPAEYAIVTEDGMQRDTYWSLTFRQQSSASPDRLADRLRDELREATRLRMRSDVPLGVFLSGGIDSTIVTALMDEVSETEVNTYSIGFDEYDELEYARTVAEKFDTTHTEYTVTPDAMEVFPEIVEHYEMPFGDPSAVPTYYVSQVASEDITVALTGDAGDENFAGYDRYTYDWLTQQVSQIPDPIRTVGQRVLNHLSELGIGFTDRGASLLENADGDTVERYAPYICHMLGEEALELWSGPPQNDELMYLRQAFDKADGPTRMDQVMQVDIHTYLPNDLLTKADRASMAHSLELRSPFLDHKTVEFASRIPAKYKWRYGNKKWLLKKAFGDIIPDSILHRSKQGFSVPVNEWFRNDLRELARENLDRLGDREPFDKAPLSAKLQAHLDGADYGFQLWDLVLLEQWYERFVDE